MKTALRASLLTAILLPACYARLQPMPDGTSYEGTAWPTSDVHFLADLTWTDAAGTRHVEQHIFDEAFAMIENAERFVLVDMFLYNDFQGELREETRALAKELTEALIARKRALPGLEAIVISDPVNTVYGGVESVHFAALRKAGIGVVLTRLEELRDSNPGYSSLWRLLLRPFGNRRGGVLPSPFGDGRVSLRSYLALLNFKANHRKLVIADDGDRWAALVTSANPHDGSSAHGNVALRFSGPAVDELLETEKAVVAFSGGDPPTRSLESPDEAAAQTVRVLTEGKIHDWIVDRLETAGADSAIDVGVFYLSDRHVIDGLIGAHQRGATLRVLLDPNKDAFGYEKNGIPNRPAAAELVRAGIPVRWCDTHGEQCHAKMMIVRTDGGARHLLAGSANFTRRNLEDYNLETSVVVSSDAKSRAIEDALAYFELVWGNGGKRHFSVPYEVYADESLPKELLYEFEEGTGLSTF
jgi:phosphatidylserine/phosphatidylglycerophosphate/cardiolipin synthase-like enzyme